MITLTLATPDNDILIGAGFTALVVSKSSTGTSVGPFVASGSPIPLVLGTLSYTFIDPAGLNGDWYITQYSASGTLSAASPPQPAYLSAILTEIRDLLGASTTDVSDTQIMGNAYLPAALARIRKRLPTFDTLIYAGGDPAGLCLGALAHYTAAMLCPRMTVAIMDAEQFKDYRYQRNRQLDWGATATQLMEKYEELISLAAGEVSSNNLIYVTGMLLAGPTAAGNDNSGLVPFNPDPLEENPLLPYTLVPPNIN